MCQNNALNDDISKKSFYIWNKCLKVRWFKKNIMPMVDHKGSNIGLKSRRPLPWLLLPKIFKTWHGGR